MTAQKFEIRVMGPPEYTTWAARFEEVEILPVGVGGGCEEFILRGVIPDQPALHGLLGRIRAASLVLISVRLTSLFAELGQRKRGED